MSGLVDERVESIVWMSLKMIGLYSFPPSYYIQKV
jgi:hypothetical protein